MFLEFSLTAEGSIVPSPVGSEGTAVLCGRNAGGGGNISLSLDFLRSLSLVVVGDFVNGALLSDISRGSGFFGIFVVLVVFFLIFLIADVVTVDGSVGL